MRGSPPLTIWPPRCPAEPCSSGASPVRGRNSLTDARAASPRVVEIALVALTAAVFLHLLLFRQGSFVHERDPIAAGFMFDEPARVAAGEVMYRDFFDFLGPGLIYLHASVMYVF